MRQGPRTFTHPLAGNGDPTLLYLALGGVLVVAVVAAWLLLRRRRAHGGA